MSHIESLNKGGSGVDQMDTETYNSALSSLVQMTERENDKGQLDKKTRREIANSNERRRMQSINTGFMRLKALVPTISKEKVSKQTAEHIEKLERENRQLKQLLQKQNPGGKIELKVDETEKETKSLSQALQMVSEEPTETIDTSSNGTSSDSNLNPAMNPALQQLLFAAQLKQLNNPLVNQNNQSNQFSTAVNLLQAMELVKSLQSNQTDQS